MAVIIKIFYRFAALTIVDHCQQFCCTSCSLQDREANSKFYLKGCYNSLKYEQIVTLLCLDATLITTVVDIQLLRA